MDIKQNLIDLNAVQVNVSVNDWRDAIRVAAVPLITHRYIEPRYVETIIKNTEQDGPYYVLDEAPLAMPHAHPEDGVLKTGFSLVTLASPISFEGSVPVDIVMMFGAINGEMHISEGLQAILLLIEQGQKLAAIRKADSVAAVLNALG
ncbi:MAG: Ascorbate-specific PTS system EIIA component [Candidatus Celerinatantimonas neptuna]|nr:MAG: Ascorbate-specific PTS system EIIA component [Candidatus Celerinatantimonas neptuna]